MTFERFDIVVVPFPFTDRSVKLRRPAIILSDKRFSAKTGQSLLAMITRAERSAWPDDLAISDLATAGLNRPCVVRLKLFTLVDTLISPRLGKLSEPDARKLKRILANHLDITWKPDEVGSLASAGEVHD